jgi:hypothetical protein
VRFSRPCYDKYHRCPGWAGGGWKYAKESRCDGGYITWTYYDVEHERRIPRPWYLWRFNRCPKCRVIVLPYMSRWLDPTWLMWKLERWKDRLADLRWEWNNRSREEFWEELLRYPRWRRFIWRHVVSRFFE